MKAYCKLFPLWSIFWIVLWKNEGNVKEKPLNHTFIYCMVIPYYIWFWLRKNNLVFLFQAYAIIYRIYPYIYTLICAVYGLLKKRMVVEQEDSCF